MQYRRLKLGEIIAEADEFLSSLDGTWKIASVSTSVGKKLDLMHVRYRRPIKVEAQKTQRKQKPKPKVSAAAKRSHNTRKLFATTHAAYHKWELRHPEVTSSEYCFVAGVKWAARQLA